MNILIIYFIVIIIANTIGAISGMGGGVIIKPIFDLIGYHSLFDITFYSSVAVLTMSISSTYKQLKNKVKINWNQAILISLGSIFGGILGNNLLISLIDYYSETNVKYIQIILTIVSLLLVLFYTLFSTKKYYLGSLISYIFVGLFLGGFSTLLGIGGGPINVTLLIFCFGLSMKDATVYSIITIFFSQLSKLIMVGLSVGFGSFDTSVILTIIIAALIGGYIGGLCSGYFSNKQVSNLFIVVVCLVIVINIYNAVTLLFY